MRATQRVTVVMILAAMGAVACSKEEKPAPAKPASRESVEKVPVPTTYTVSEQGSGVSTPAPAVSSSFADGEAAFKARKYGEATAIFQSYVARKPKNVTGHYMVGLSAWKSGDLATSEKAFEQALSLDGKHMRSLVNESRLFIDQQRYDEALDRLTRASAIDPGSFEVLRLLGRTYAAKGKTNDAIAAYRAAIEANEHDAWSMNNLGLVLIQAKRADEALPFLAKATELKSDVAEFHNNLGIALEQTGRFKAAAGAYGDALAANSGYAKAKTNLARVNAVKSGAEAPFDRAEAAKSVQPQPQEGEPTTGDGQVAIK